MLRTTKQEPPDVSKPFWYKALLNQSRKDRSDISKATGVSCLYANAPFFSIHDGTRRRLAACMPAPPFLGDIREWDEDPWSDIVFVDWKTGVCSFAEDESFSGLAGEPVPGGVNTVFVDGRNFCRQWALSRETAMRRFRDAAVPGLMFNDELHGAPPGVLVVGDAKKVVGWSDLIDSLQVKVDTRGGMGIVSAMMARAAALPEVIAL